MRSRIVPAKFVVSAPVPGDRNSDEIHRISAFDAAGNKIGRIHLWGDDAHITGIEVTKPSLMRRGIGTALYEFAAAYACRVLLQPLKSGTQRSDYADNFWRKQHDNGRARCVGPVHDERRCKSYELTCPPPSSLERMKLR